MNTLASFLMHDHVHCDALLKAASAAVASRAWSQAAREAADFAGAIEHHLLLEERVVFPAFERQFQYAVLPTVGLRSEHLRIRAVVQRVVDAVTARDSQAFVRHADALLLLLHEHSEKEEGILYPMIERALGASARQLVTAMARFGRDEDEDEEDAEAAQHELFGPVARRANSPGRRHDDVLRGPFARRRQLA